MVMVTVTEPHIRPRSLASKAEPVKVPEAPELAGGGVVLVGVGAGAAVVWVGVGVAAVPPAVVFVGLGFLVALEVAFEVAFFVALEVFVGAGVVAAAVLWAGVGVAAGA